MNMFCTKSELFTCQSLLNVAFIDVPLLTNIKDIYLKADKYLYLISIQENSASRTELPRHAICLPILK